MIKQSREKQEIIKKIIIIMLITLLTFMVSLTLRSNPFSQFLPRHDSSMFQYFGYAMDKGKTMYTEIFDHKGPMIFFINYLGILLSTEYIQGLYILEFITIFVYFFFSYKTINIWTGKLQSFILLIPQGIALTYYLFGGNFTEEFALPFIAASIYIFSKYFITRKNVHVLEIVFLGFACALVFSLRANMVVVWLAFCIVIFIKIIIKKEYKMLLNYTIFFTLGLLLFFVPVGIYLYLNGALGESIFQSITFNLMYVDGSENQNDAIMSLYTQLSNQYIIFILNIFLILIITKWKKTDFSTQCLFIAIILFSVGSYLTAVMSGRDYAHYLIIMVPTLTLPSAFLFNKFTDDDSKYPLIVVMLISIVLIYYAQINHKIEEIYVLNTPVEKVSSQDSKVNIDETNSNMHLNQQIVKNSIQKQQAIEVAQVIKENTKLTDKIYIHRLAGNLYLLSDRVSSIKYFNLPAIDLNENQLIGEDFLTEFIQSNTEIVVISTAFKNMDKIGFEASFFDYVIENYELIYDQNHHHIYKWSN